MNFLIELLFQGGWVMFVLLGESVIGVALLIYLLHCLILKPNTIYTHSFYLKINRRVAWLSHIASLSTLTGLLGTVLGIHNSFQKMKIQGKISLESFSTGITTALLTTIYGLSMAILFIFFYHILSDKVEELYEIFDEQKLEN